MLHFISKNIKHYLMQRPSERFGIEFNPLNALIWRYPLRIRFDINTETLVADDGQREFHFCRNVRAMRYVNGIDNFLMKLAHAYIVDDIALAPGDWMVDCGANVGEVSAWLTKKQPELNVIAVEPEELEANCADQNIYGGAPRTLRKLLWKEETTLRFYSAAEAADSSVFETAGYSEVREVAAITLDALLSASGAKRLRILKLEAEGAEPEILQGCVEWLPRIDYIAADLGPERGLAQEHTVTPVVNYLLARNFELVDMRFDRVTCLFRNKSAPH